MNLDNEIANGQHERLDQRYVSLLRHTGFLRSFVWSLIWGAIVAAIVAWTDMRDEYDVPLISAWGIFTVTHLVWGQVRPGLLYRHSSFRVADDQIEIASGIFVRSLINVPRSRVQHTDVSQGPFERRYGLGTLHIYTAGVSHALVPLPGLSHARALAIRDLLLPRDRT